MNRRDLLTGAIAAAVAAPVLAEAAKPLGAGMDVAKEGSDTTVFGHLFGVAAGGRFHLMDWDIHRCMMCGLSQEMIVETLVDCPRVFPGRWVIRRSDRKLAWLSNHERDAHALIGNALEWWEPRTRTTGA